MTIDLGDKHGDLVRYWRRNHSLDEHNSNLQAFSQLQHQQCSNPLEVIPIRDMPWTLVHFFVVKTPSH